MMIQFSLGLECIRSVTCFFMIFQNLYKKLVLNMLNICLEEAVTLVIAWEIRNYSGPC